MFKLPKWSVLSNREKVLSALVLVMFAAICGLLANRLPGVRSLSWEAVSAIGTAFGSIVTFVAVVLAVYGYRQSKEAHRSEFRALLRLEIGEISWWETGRFRMEITAYNSGRTPASFVEGECRMIFFNGSTGALVELSDNTFSVWAQDVQPQFSSPVHVRPRDDLEFPGCEWEKLAYTTAAMFVFLEIPYLDDFGGRHTARHSATYSVTIEPSTSYKLTFSLTS